VSRLRQFDLVRNVRLSSVLDECTRVGHIRIQASFCAVASASGLYRFEIDVHKVNEGRRRPLDFESADGLRRTLKVVHLNALLVERVQTASVETGFERMLTVEQNSVKSTDIDYTQYVCSTS
jgi:hypothetical protein